MSKDPYGRPYRRRKAARFSPGLLCSICGKPILTFAEYTLHHVVAVRTSPRRAADLTDLRSGAFQMP
jgi:hypothetical protein